MTARALRLGRLEAVVLTSALIVALLAGNVAAMTTYRADVRPTYGGEGLLTILVLGSDVGWPDRPGDETRGRADGLHLIAVDVGQRRATVVSVPRDALIGGRKVNAHLALGGPEAMVAQMEAYTGVDIAYWALTSFLGLQSLVEAMGGVEIEVERRMSSPEAGADLHPGQQRLGGHDALAFSRDRKSQPRGDFDRTRNQGRLIAAAHAQMQSQQRDLVTLTRLSSAFIRHTHTNIPREEVMPLALLAAEIPPDQVRLVPLAGGFGTTRGGASIVHLDTGGIFDRIREGHVGP
jgi:LCP family protein required for cell wall assembly